MRKAIIFCTFLVFSFTVYSQDDVMMQAFYWDVPVDAQQKDGTWWDNLRQKSDSLKTAGFIALWVPSPAKGNYGIYDMGYGIYDYYDLGNYKQKGTIESRFGSRKELEMMIAEMHKGKNKIDVYADIILNHMIADNSRSSDDMGHNQAVKDYVFGEAQNGKHAAYQTNDILWIVRDAEKGEYEIAIKGYNLKWNEPENNRSYQFYIDWKGDTLHDKIIYEAKPGALNKITQSGINVRGTISSEKDIDIYHLSLSHKSDIVIKLEARKQVGKKWEWTSQTNGYYPCKISYNGKDITQLQLEAHTPTNINFVEHTGKGEANFNWRPEHFHPSNGDDWLDLDTDKTAPISTNIRWWGNDMNTFHPQVQARMNAWGKWLAEEIGFDGFRMDFVRGYQPEFLASWVKNLPEKNNHQRFVVGEYWTSYPFRLKNWVDTLSAMGADVKVFDFPLQFTLSEMCNTDTFNMKRLHDAGMINNKSGFALPPSSVVTFVDNHDTGKESDKWIAKNHKLAYAYILTHPGRPCVFYSHYYGIKQYDYSNHDITTMAPTGLQNDINQLIKLRKNYLNGGLTVLQILGGKEIERKAYAAIREGKNGKNGAIIVINNSNEDITISIDAQAKEIQKLIGKTLVDYINKDNKVSAIKDKPLKLSVKAKDFAIFISERDL